MWKPTVTETWSKFLYFLLFRQIDRQINRQIDRQIDRQIYTLKKVVFNNQIKIQAFKIPEMDCVFKTLPYLTSMKKHLAKTFNGETPRC